MLIVHTVNNASLAFCMDIYCKNLRVNRPRVLTDYLILMFTLHEILEISKSLLHREHEFQAELYTSKKL